MNKDSRIYVAGHKGLVGSALVRSLTSKGFTNLIFRTSSELDLRRQADVEDFFEKERPEYVFMAAGKVGGIRANNTFKAEFIYDNIMLASNVINCAYKYGVRKLLNLGSSCIYPKLAHQPMKEESLLTGLLEPTNEPYAVAKIAAIKLCRYYNEQHDTNFISVMPTNLYGPGDNFDLLDSHVLPALIRKMHLGKCLQNKDFDAIRRDIKYSPLDGRNVDDLKDEEIANLLAGFGIKTVSSNASSPLTPHSSLSTSVEIWGSGEPYREFLYVDDLAGACVYLMERYNYSDIGEFVNVGAGEDIKIKDMAEVIKDIVGFEGQLVYNPEKPDGTPKKLLDITRIRALGWKPQMSLQDGLRETYKWYAGAMQKADTA